MSNTQDERNYGGQSLAGALAFFALLLVGLILLVGPFLAGFFVAVLIVGCLFIYLLVKIFGFFTNWWLAKRKAKRAAEGRAMTRARLAGQQNEPSELITTEPKRPLISWPVKLLVFLIFLAVSAVLGFSLMEKLG